MDKDTDIQHCPEVTDLAKSTVAISATVSFNNAAKILALTMNIQSLFFFFYQIPQNLATKCQVCSAKGSLSTPEARVTLSGTDVKYKQKDMKIKHSGSKLPKLNCIVQNYIGHGMKSTIKTTVRVLSFHHSLTAQPELVDWELTFK